MTRSITGNYIKCVTGYCAFLSGAENAAIGFETPIFFTERSKLCSNNSQSEQPCWNSHWATSRNRTSTLSSMPLTPVLRAEAAWTGRFTKKAARPLWKKQGHPGAQCYLGAHYENGFGVEKNDKEPAQKILDVIAGDRFTQCRKAAEQGNVETQVALALDYYHGKPVPIFTLVDSDDETPLHWAAKHGPIEALAFLLKKGARTDSKDNQGNLPIDVVDSDEKKCLLREATDQL